MLDVYVPEGASGPLPVVFHVHGGGWQRGDRKTSFYGGPFMGYNYAQHGFIAVVISYRVSVLFPDPILDVANALKWVLHTIDTFGGDPTKIVISGHSAGGHLVSLLATNPQFLSSVGITENPIKAVISISGIYTVSNPLSENPNDWMNTMYRSVYVNRTFGSDHQKLMDYSPSYHILKYPVTDPTAQPPAPPPKTGLLSNLSLPLFKKNQGLTQNQPPQPLPQPLNPENQPLTEELPQVQSQEQSEKSQTTTDLKTEEPKELLTPPIPLPTQPEEVTPAPTSAPLPKIPPFCIFNATSDLSLDHDGRYFTGLLRERGIKVVYEVLTANHATITNLQATVDKATKFIREQLGIKESC
uniref:BD-FAE-like domain-containing protein n=1 Tax=Arcella intermedia TaxID=1963864 RepID=A0A6B2L8J7_9EUKA